MNNILSIADNWLLVVICIVVVIAIFVFGSYLYTKLRKKTIHQKLSLLASSHNLVLNSSEDKNYDYILTKDGFTYLIRLSYIPSNSAVTINSKDTWSLTWGGSKGNSGRVYPKQRYMNELIPFLRMKEQDKVRKIVILYPETEKVLKYLNESDIAVVTPKDTPYQMKVIPFNKLDEHFLDIL